MRCWRTRGGLLGWFGRVLRDSTRGSAASGDGNPVFTRDLAGSGRGDTASPPHYCREVSMRAVPDPSYDGGSRERAAEALRRATCSLSTAAMSRMLADMARFAVLPAESRSWVCQSFQAGVQGF